jgi:hypothetical protein
MIMKGEKVRIWKEVVVAYFCLLTRNLPGEVEEEEE